MHVPIMCLMFNSKLLHSDYLKNINKNNINIALNNLITPLENIIKLSNRLLLNGFEIVYTDFTENIKIKDYEIKDCLQSIKLYSNIDNKKVFDKYDNSLSYQLSYKTRFLFYDKHNEIIETVKARKKSTNKDFFNKYNDLIDKSKNLLRFERRLNKDLLYKSLSIPKSEKITLAKILNSNKNIVYTELQKITKKELKKITEIKSKKTTDFFDNLIGKALNDYYKNDNEKIRRAVFNSSKSKPQKYKDYHKAIRLKNEYNSSKNKNKIDYKKIFEYLLNQLKTA